MAGAVADHAWASSDERSSNGVRLNLAPERFAPMRDSTDVADQPDELRRRIAEDGYVLLRGVLDPSAVLRLRDEYFTRLETVVTAGAPAYGTPGHPAYDFVRSPVFDAFTRAPALAGIAGLLMGGAVELVPRRIVRHFEAHSVGASRAHVDIDYLDHGTTEVLTAWIPLGDCPISAGGLIYLEGSHRASRADLDALRPYTDRPDDARPVSNDLGRTATALGGRWLWADLRAGDLAVHTAQIVHASLDNVSDAPRLSIDVRFRRNGDARDERWDGDWSADDGY